MTRLLVFGLAVWRLSHVLVNESGPGGSALKLRELSGIEHDDSGHIVAWDNDWTPLSCMWCTSIWAAALLLLAPAFVQVALAGSAVAVFVEEIRGARID